MIKTCLLAHPAMPHPDVKSLEVNVELTPEGDLVLLYQLNADLTQFIIPVTKPAAQTDGLWEHVCFEAFIAVVGQPDYLEYNFAPSGQWAAYAFSDYRVRRERTFSQTPKLDIIQMPEQLLMLAIINAKDLPVNPQALPLAIGLATVLEAVDTSLSYWALQHPLQNPDFHHRSGFTLLIKQV